MGYTPEVTNAVTLLTKRKGVPYIDEIQRIADSGNKIAIAVRIADNLDNLDATRVARLSADDQRKTEKYRQSLAILRGRTLSPTSPTRDKTAKLIDTKTHEQFLISRRR